MPINKIRVLPVCQFFSFDYSRQNVEVCNSGSFSAVNVRYIDLEALQIKEKSLPATSIFWTWAIREHGDFRGPVLTPFFPYNTWNVEDTKAGVYIQVPVTDSNFLKDSEALKPNEELAVTMTDSITNAAVFVVTPPYPKSSLNNADRLRSLELWFRMDADAISMGKPALASEDYPDMDFFACKKESDSNLSSKMAGGYKDPDRIHLYFGNPIASLIADRASQVLAGAGEPITSYDNRAFETSSLALSAHKRFESEVEADFRLYKGMSCQPVKLVREYLPWNATGIPVGGEQEAEIVNSKYERLMTANLAKESRPPLGGEGEVLATDAQLEQFRNIGLQTWVKLFLRPRPKVPGAQTHIIPPADQDTEYELGLFADQRTIASGS
ncbi:hypothetical protein DRE_00888 [Drechslerella stenobrocha 248]|uniref:Uncharacterized protein n=1 Tax=Drechslerella stenobrocha 248 TaxID=1043628 RepID=W7HQT1_9PEZI|nr:hypothetical protein DRE_00888 [Drechslerella stenobrocha 248]